MKLCVKPFENLHSDSFILSSKTKLTAEKVHKVLKDECYYFDSLEAFKKDIWTLLEQGIIVYNRTKCIAYLIPQEM